MCTRLLPLSPLVVYFALVRCTEKGRTLHTTDSHLKAILATRHRRREYRGKGQR